MKLPAAPTFLGITSPVPAEGNAEESSTSPFQSPPVRINNLRQHASDVNDIYFLEKAAGMGMRTSTTSSASAPNNVSATGSSTGSDMGYDDMDNWFKKNTTKTDNELLTTGKELEDLVGGVERQLMKIWSSTMSIQEQTKAIMSLVTANGTNGIKVLETLESMLAEQTANSETLNAVATTQAAMATTQAADSATLNTMAATQATMATTQAADNATIQASLDTMSSQIATLLTELSTLKAKSSQDDKAEAKAIAANDAAAENVERAPTTTATLIPEAEAKTTAEESGALQRERAEKNQLQKEVERLRMEREKAEQVDKFLSNHKTADQILAEMQNAPPMPKQQKESLAKHQHRMHPKTQEDAAKKRSGKGGRMRFRY